MIFLVGVATGGALVFLGYAMFVWNKYGDLELYVEYLEELVRKRDIKPIPRRGERRKEVK